MRAGWQSSRQTVWGAISTAIDWATREDETGSVAPGQMCAASPTRSRGSMPSGCDNESARARVQLCWKTVSLALRHDRLDACFAKSRIGISVFPDADQLNRGSCLTQLPSGRSRCYVEPRY